MRRTPLKQLAHLNRQVLPEDTPNDFEFDYIDIASVSSEGGIGDTTRLRFASAPSRARRVVRSGDVIVSTVRTYLRAVAPISDVHDGQICSTGFAVLTARTGVEPEFLRYATCERGFVEEVVARSTGVSYPAINPAEVARIPVPHPDLKSQRVIADFLDRECDRISELAGELSEYKTMISSRWLSAFERSLSREPHTRRLKHFEADLQLGPFGSLLGADEYVSDGIPVINPMHIHWHGLRPEDGVTVAEDGAASLRRYRLRTGDVVLARRGELGRACVVRGSEDGYICGTGSARMRVDPSRLAPEFLVFALMTEPARAHMMLTAVGSTMPNLNAPALLDLRLPDWPVGEQLAAVAAAMASWESSAVLMEEVRGTYEALMEYRDALITEAVTGELDVSRLSDRQLDESARAALEGETSEVLAR